MDLCPASYTSFVRSCARRQSLSPGSARRMLSRARTAPDPIHAQRKASVELRVFEC